MLKPPLRSMLAAFVAALACVALVAVQAAAPAQAASGDLDAAFGVGGLQTTDFGGNDKAFGALSQPDGRLVVVGRTYAGPGSGLSFAVARYRADGTLDPTFSGDGKQTTDFAGDGIAHGVALQGDGKIVVVGDANGGGTFDFALARYNPDGSLDLSFSGDGRQLTDLSGGTDSAAAAVIQPDRKIVVAGRAGDDFGVARYNPDGSLDPSFGIGGLQRTHLGVTGYDSDYAAAVALQPDGKIVVAGTTDPLPPCDFSIDTCTDPPPDFALVRYNTDGSLDGSFSGDGKQATDFGSEEEAFGVALQPDGKIDAVGRSSSSEFALARYAPDGALDSSFSDDGKQTTAFRNAGPAAAVAVQSDGKMLVAGGQGDFALARYAIDGSLDPTLSADGKQTTDFGGSDDASSVVLQSDGNIVVAGTTFRGAGEDFALVRYQGGSSTTGWAPENATVPSVYGVPVEEQTLTVNPGEWIGSAPMSYSYQWRRCDSIGANCLDIPGASAATYVAVASDVGHTMRVRVTATNAYGRSSIESGASTVIAAKPGGPPVNLTPPSISGSATEGQTLTVNAGVWSGSAPMTYSYQWRRCDSIGANCLDIPGASAATYVAVASDVGHTMRVRVTATNAYGRSSIESGATTATKAKPGTIAGAVRNQKTGAAIAGASVTCTSGYSSKTGSTGSYSIPNVPPGSYTCTAAATGYRPTPRTVAVSAGQTATANFSLARQ